MSTPSARSNKNDLSLEDHLVPSESSVLIPKYITNDANKAHVFKWCRMTGLLYTIIIICGIYADAGVRGRYISFSSATETTKNIVSHALQFRSTILFELIMCISDICVAVLLSAIFFYSNKHSGEGSIDKKFHHVNKNITIVLMALFRLIQTTIIACNLLHSFAASLILDPSFASVTAAGIGLKSIMSDVKESDGEGGNRPLLAENLALLFLSIQKYGYTLALVFFGISLALLGILMIKHESNTLIQFPEMLGFSCILAGIGYILDAVMYFTWTSYDGQISGLFMLPVFVAEFWLAGWLLSVKLHNVDVVQ